MSRVLFGGKALREPTAASVLRIGVQPAVNPNATNRVAVLGSSEGGIPQQVYTFSSFADARAVLRSGDSLKAINHIFNPSPAFAGAAQVDFVRLDTATAASRNLLDATTPTAKTAFTVTSVDQGTWVNGIQLTVAADGSGRKVTVKVPGATIQSGTDGVAVATNRFSSTSAKFISRGAATGDVIVVVGAGATTVTVYTIASVVSETEVTTTETVTVGSALTWFHTAYIRVQVSPTLAAVAGATNLNANIVNWLNDNCGDVFTATLGASDATLVAATTGNNPLTGGTVTAFNTTGALDTGLALLRNRQVNHIYVAKACGTESGELSFAGNLIGHVLNDADIPAMIYLGAKADKTVDQAITYAGALNSARAVYCFQTVFDSAVDGLGTEEVPGYLLAAKVAGLAAGLDAQTPLTRKPLSILGIKALPSNRMLDKATREALLDAGILHVYQPAGANTFVINQGLTTLQNNDNLWDTATASSSEISLMRIVDSILTDLRQSAASTFIGQSSTLARPVIEHFVQSYLQSQVGTLLQSYSGISVTQVQDKWYVNFGIVPAYPTNFILITGTVLG